MSIFSTIRERYKIQKGEDIREVSFKDLQSAEPVNEVSANTEFEAFISVIENSRRGGHITVKETDDIDQFFNAMEIKPMSAAQIEKERAADYEAWKAQALKNGIQEFPAEEPAEFKFRLKDEQYKGTYGRRMLEEGYQGNRGLSQDDFLLPHEIIPASEWDITGAMSSHQEQIDYENGYGNYQRDKYSDILELLTNDIKKPEHCWGNWMDDSKSDYGSEKYNDKDFIAKEVLSMNGLKLEIAPDEIKNDRELVDIAIKQNPKARDFASDEIKIALQRENMELLVPKATQTVKPKNSMKM